VSCTQVCRSHRLPLRRMAPAGHVG
jgi:hypothetical protein